MVSEAAPDQSVAPTSVLPENSAQQCIESLMLDLKDILASSTIAASWFYALFDPDSGKRPMLSDFEVLQNFVPNQLSDEILPEERGLVLLAIQELSCTLADVGDRSENEQKLAFELFKVRARAELMLLVTDQVASGS